MNDSRNVAARMGRWSAQHRKIAIFGWFGFVAVAFALGGVIGTKTARSGEGRSRGIGPRRQDPGRRVRDSRDRARDDPVRHGHGQLSRVQGRDQRRRGATEAGA